MLSIHQDKADVLYRVRHASLPHNPSGVVLINSTPSSDRAEQRLRMCRDGRGLGSKLVSFAKGFSKHHHVLAIFKVDSKYLRFSFKVKVDYFILHSILVYSFVILLVFFAMTKRRRTNEASLLNQYRLQKDFLNILTFCRLLRWFSKYLRFPFNVKVDYFILHSILFSSFVIFLIFFAMSRKKMHVRSRTDSDSNVYMFKRKQK